ncbi:MAG: hypothetical protein M1557_06610 [Actinobacteria bacterium]|nr:hypothetical protein [Actinomycetota bacterium]
MIVRAAILVCCGFIVAIATHMSQRTPSGRRNERLLRHLRPVGERAEPQFTVFKSAVVRVRRELAVTMVDQSWSHYVTTITANATVITAATMVILSTVATTPLLAPAAVVLWLAAVVTQRLVLHAGARQMRALLRNDLPLLLSELQSSLERGNSLTSSLIMTATTTQTAWRSHLERGAASLTRGESVTTVLMDLAEMVTLPDVSRALELLALSHQHHVAQQLTAQLLSQSKLDHHHRLIATAGKREQLIWVPVAIATLIPGVILVIVPLIGSLRLLALH